MDATRRVWRAPASRWCGRARREGVPGDERRPLRAARERMHAVSDVSLEVRRGETLALVGETGCGKSTLARCIMRLHDLTSGRIVFDGQRHLRARRMPSCGQSAGGCRWSSRIRTARSTRGAGSAPSSAIRSRSTASRVAPSASRRVQELMELVGLNPEHYNRFPGDFSGGQRQRIGIARAIALQPDLIVCDEPVSALDVSIRAQILNLLADLQARAGADLPLHLARSVGGPPRQRPRRGDVPRHGRGGGAGATISTSMPRHPYTRALLSAMPVPAAERAGAQ